MFALVVSHVLECSFIHTLSSVHELSNPPSSPFQVLSVLVFAAIAWQYYGVRCVVLLLFLLLCRGSFFVGDIFSFFFLWQKFEYLVSVDVDLLTLDDSHFVLAIFSCKGPLGHNLQGDALPEFVMHVVFFLLV